MAWRPIEEAPKSYMTQYYRKKLGKPVAFEELTKVWVHTWKPGCSVLQSYYIPEEDRWMAYTKECPPTMFHPYPEAPDV